MQTTETQVKTYKNAKDYQHDVKKMSKQGWIVVGTVVDKKHRMLARDKQEMVITYQRGQNQSLQPQQPQPVKSSLPKYPPKPLSRNTKIGCGVFSGLVVLIIIIAIATSTASGSQSPSTSNASSPSDNTSAPSSQPTQQPTQTLDQQINQLVQNAGATGTNIVSHYNVGGDNAEVIDETTQGNLTNGLTVEGIKLDCWDFQKALWTSPVASKISDVTVRISGQLVDQYGHTSTGLWGACDLTSATAKNFVWDNLTQDQAWDDYDNTYILPSLNS